MSDSRRDLFRMDRTAISFGDMRDQSREYREAILALSPRERLLVIEHLRQCQHGPDYAAQPFRRVLTIVEPGGR